MAAPTCLKATLSGLFRASEDPVFYVDKISNAAFTLLFCCIIGAPHDGSQLAGIAILQHASDMAESTSFGSYSATRN